MPPSRTALVASVFINKSVKCSAGPSLDLDNKYMVVKKELPLHKR